MGNVNLTEAQHSMQLVNRKGRFSLQIHINGCANLNVASKARGEWVKPYDAETVADMEERGFKVPVCKCCK